MMVPLGFNELRRKVLKRERLSTRINTELDLHRNIISKIHPMVKSHFEFITMLSYSKAVSHSLHILNNSTLRKRSLKISNNG